MTRKGIKRSEFVLAPGRPFREFILSTDHLRGKQPYRTDYSEFETPTIVRRLAEQARSNRRAKP